MSWMFLSRANKTFCRADKTTISFFSKNVDSVFPAVSQILFVCHRALIFSTSSAVRKTRKHYATALSGLPILRLYD